MYKLQPNLFFELRLSFAQLIYNDISGEKYKTIFIFKLMIIMQNVLHEISFFFI